MQSVWTDAFPISQYQLIKKINIPKSKHYNSETLIRFRPPELIEMRKRSRDDTRLVNYVIFHDPLGKPINTMKLVLCQLDTIQKYDPLNTLSTMPLSKYVTSGRASSTNFSISQMATIVWQEIRLNTS